MHDIILGYNMKKDYLLFRDNIFKYYYLFFIVLFIINFSTAYAYEKLIPFQPGEKLTYKLKWNFIPAGYAVLEVCPFGKIDNQKAYHFKLQARTNAFVDTIYKVRDEINSYCDQYITHSVSYRKKIHEGRTKRDIVLFFDWLNEKVIYSNFNKKLEPVSIYPGTFDPLSAFFYFRCINFDNNKSFIAPVTDGKKCILGKALIIKKEKIKVSAGKFETFLVEPEIKHIKGVFEKSKNAKIQIWITSDHRRIPVLFRSKVIVGSFYAELISIENNDKK